MRVLGQTLDEQSSILYYFFVLKRIGYSNADNVNIDNTRAPVWLDRSLHASSVCRMLHLLRGLVDA